MTGSGILLFSRDPGGANQMVAVHGLLSGWWEDDAVRQAPGVAAFLDRVRRGGGTGHLISLAKDYANPVWERAGLAHRDWDEAARGDSPADVLRRLAQAEGISVLVSGTSDVDDDTDVLLWRAAAEMEMPTHVFVDQDSNVVRRFETRAGLTARPQHVYLPGEAARSRLLDAGWPATRLDLVPDLHLAVVRRRAYDDDARHRMRRSWGIAEDRPVILFASENVRELAALGKPSPYSEFACLDALLQAVTGKATIEGLTLTGAEAVVIRPHPKDETGKYSAAAAAAPGIVTVSRSGTAEEAILGADIVVGMRSSLLGEAEALGRPVVSLYLPAAADCGTMQG